MKAVVFRGPNHLSIEELPKPTPRAGQAVIRVTATTICGTDVHILKGEYDVRPGLVLGHEPVGVIDDLAEDLAGEYETGQRVVVSAVTPCGQCFFCLDGAPSQCRGPLGAWRFGNTINGAWAEFLLVPDARANLAPIPYGLSDEDVLLVPDVLSAGLSGAEKGEVKVGDAVAVFAQGPLGVCATLGARLRGAALVFAVDTVPERLELARRFGATITLDATQVDPVAEIKRLTDGRGVDVAIEALGRQQTFESCLRVVRPGGTVSSLGMYSGKVVTPYDAFHAGLADLKIVTTLCPGGKERMRRLMALIAAGRVNLKPLVTHRFLLDRIDEALDLFAHHRDGVMKVALYPTMTSEEQLELETVGAREVDPEC